MNKRWEILSKKSDDIIKQILINRNIPESEKEDFLNPDFEKGLQDPFQNLEMQKAAAHVKGDILKGERLGIFADYDADGIPASAFLYKAIIFLQEKLNSKVLPPAIYIPKREEGYGLSKEGIDSLNKAACQTIFAVDLGSTNKDEISYAKKKGLNVIVLDHHQILKTEFPNEALAVLNLKIKNQTYNFKDFSSAGVAFKFVQSLFQASQISKGAADRFLKWNLDLVAISTICDIVPLLGENRILAKFGLIVLQKTKNLGLQKLYQKMQIDPAKIGPYNVSFQIGPRLNAPGRMDSATESFYLLISEDEKETEKLAIYLDETNKKRQLELDRCLKEAKEKIIKNNLHKKKVILIYDKNWSKGIVGLVAGKLMEEFARPTFVLEEGDKTCSGSARSIQGFHLVETLEKAKEYLVSHGGHARAAGLTLETQHLENLYNRLLEIAETKLKDEDLTPKITIDAVLLTNDINYKLYRQLEKLQPHGFGNPKPVFLSHKMVLEDIRCVGRQLRHLKLKVSGFDAIGFDFGGCFADLKVNEKIDIVYNLDENTYNGESKLQFKILDLKKSPV